MKTISALLLLAASVAAVSASGACSSYSSEPSAEAQDPQAKALNVWAADLVSDVVHAGMTKSSTPGGADKWAKAFLESHPSAARIPDLKLRVNQDDGFSAKSAAFVDPTVCAGLCTAADVACKLACSALPGFLQGACKAACGLAITACNGAC